MTMEKPRTAESEWGGGGTFRMKIRKEKGRKMEEKRECKASISAGGIIAGFIMALDRSLLLLKTY